MCNDDGKHLHDRIFSQGRDVLAYKTSLTPSLFNQVPVQSQDSERSCICVFGVSIWPISVILFIGSWNCSNSVVIFFSFFSFYFHIRQKMVILVDFKVRALC